MGREDVELLGDVLLELRTRAALSQDDLAERSGISVDTIRAIEKGRHKRPHGSTLHSLSAALELPAEAQERLFAARGGVTTADSGQRKPTLDPASLDPMPRNAERRRQFWIR